MRGFLSRHRFLLPVLLAFIALVVPGSALAQDDEPGGGGGPGDELLPSFEPPPDGEITADRIIVKFKENTSPASRSDARSDEGLERKKDLDLIDAEVYEVEGQPVEQAARELERRPDVEYAEPDQIVYPTGYADEERFGDLWGLDNTGQKINGGATGGTRDVDINATEASAVTQGDENLIVAVIDEGVDFSHPDLKDRAWVNPGESGSGKETNGKDDDGNGYVDDVNGWDFYHKDKTVHETGEDSHGTHVSGTIAASANGAGIVGVAPNVKIMSLKFLGPDGGSTSDAVLAIEYAAKMGVKISNNSWGGGGYNQALKNAIEVSDMLFIAAAGNDGTNTDTIPSYPSSYTSPNILSVAATDNQGRLASFSNYGYSTVDISAPGVAILSSVPATASQPAGWEFYNGTSMATPHVTGTAALAASETSDLLRNPLDLKRALMHNGKDISGTTGSGKTATGRVIRADASVLAGAPPPDNAPPVGSLSINNGAAMTYIPFVQLALPATDGRGSGLKSMRFSNDDASWSAWEPYAAGKVWSLTPGLGPKTVYVEYQDWAENVSEKTSDTIDVSYIAKKKKKKRR